MGPTGQPRSLEAGGWTPGHTPAVGRGRRSGERSGRWSRENLGVAGSSDPGIPIPDTGQQL